MHVLFCICVYCGLNIVLLCEAFVMVMRPQEIRGSVEEEIVVTTSVELVVELVVVGTRVMTSVVGVALLRQAKMVNGIFSVESQLTRTDSVLHAAWTQQSLRTVTNVPAVMLFRKQA